MTHIRFTATSVKPTKQHFICQSRHGNWMIGVEVESPIDPTKKEICGGSCVEAPFSTLRLYDAELAKPFTVSEMQADGSFKKTVHQGDGWIDMFPTKKSLVEALQQMGYKQGERYGYHCWKIEAVA